MVQGQSTPPQPKITGVLTILTPKPGVTVEQVMKIMPAEIRATVPLYLDGKIQQWFTRGDGRGVIFLLNCKEDRKSTRLNSSHTVISYAVFCLKQKRVTLLMSLVLIIGC